MPEKNLQAKLIVFGAEANSKGSAASIYSDNISCIQNIGHMFKMESPLPGNRDFPMCLLGSYVRDLDLLVRWKELKSMVSPRPLPHSCMREIFSRLIFS